MKFYQSKGSILSLRQPVLVLCKYFQMKPQNHHNQSFSNSQTHQESKIIIKRLREFLIKTQQLQNKTMSGLEIKEETVLHMKAVTWLKDSHSLFDYEFNKNVNQETFDFSFDQKFVFMYRNNKTSEINVTENQKMIPGIYENFQLLGCFQLKTVGKKYYIEFRHASEFQGFKRQVEQALMTQESGETPVLDHKEEDIYLIVRSLKNKHNENKGYKLDVGQIIKIGRVEYKISSMKRDTNNPEISEEISDPNAYFSNCKVVECNSLGRTQEDQCKYCLQGQVQGDGNFLISPCKCSGTTGLVHFKCLEHWIQSKVKKEVSGGTLHYNFEKFFCEVCNDEFPRYIKQNGEHFQLMHIKKPQGSHMIVEGITQKSKNLMVIQNIPEDGIKIGRSHECQIRITDISVSRNHAFIQKVEEDFFVFDNKSKFGTLVREDNLRLQLSRIKQGIQIGRTVFTFQIARKSQI